MKRWPWRKDAPEPIGDIVERKFNEWQEEELEEYAQVILSILANGEMWIYADGMSDEEVVEALETALEQYE